MQGNANWRRYLRFWRADPDRDVDDELRTHFELRIADLVRLGLHPAEAKRQALDEFGDLEAARARLYEIGRRSTRRHQRFLWFDALRADLRQALRGVIRNPLLTGVVVLTLALGIGAIATTYGVMRQLLLQPPPHVVDPDRVVRLFFIFQYPLEPRTPRAVTSYGAFEAVRQQGNTFTDVAAYVADQELPVGRGVDARLGRATMVSAGFWRAFGVRPRLGRFIADDEAHPVTGARVAVLGHAFWQRHFGGDAEVVGRELHVRGLPYTIIGVAPRGFRGFEITDTDLWLPLRAWADGAPAGTTPLEMLVRVVARLRPGVSRTAAQALASNHHVAFMNQELGPRYASRPERSPQWGVEVAGVRGALDFAMNPVPEARLSVWLVVVAGILLAVACANVSGLLLLRALRRRREIAVRLALGMSRRRLAALLLAEGSMVAVLGGAAAAVVVALAGPWVRGILLEGMIAAPAGTDWAVVIVAAACTVGAAVVAGLAPLVQLRADPITGLRDGGERGATRRSVLFRLLLVTQTALSVVLLIGAGLFVRSVQRIAALDHGMDVDRVLTIEADFTGTGRAASEQAAFYERALQRARRVPGVEHASLARFVPLRGEQGGGVFRLAGSSEVVQQPDGRAPRVNLVAGDFFAATGMRLIEGRDFTAGDRAGPASVVVNERLARHAWPGRSPVGECVYLSATPDECSPVVGVVSDARMFDIREELRFWFYRPLPAGDTTGSRVLLVRVPRGGAAVQTSLRRALHELDPALPYIDVRRLGDPLDPQIRPWRLGVSVFTAFGMLAAVVAAIGLYAAVSYAISQRTREIGVRVAVGATKVRVVGMVLGDGCRTALAGIVIGLVAGLAAGPLIAGHLFEVSPRDPVVLIAVAVGALTTAALASLIPARRAAAVEPMAALRID